MKITINELKKLIKENNEDCIIRKKNIMKIKREYYERVINAMTLSYAEWEFYNHGTRAEYLRYRKSAAANAIANNTHEIID